MRVWIRKGGKNSSIILRRIYPQRARCSVYISIVPRIWRYKLRIHKCVCVCIVLYNMCIRTQCMRSCIPVSPRAMVGSADRGCDEGGGVVEGTGRTKIQVLLPFFPD